MIFRRRVRAVVAAAVTAGTLTATGLVAAPQASAATSQQIGYEIAFRADDSRFTGGTNTLWAWWGDFSNGSVFGSFVAEALSARPDFAPGTSPSTAALPSGSFQIVWQGLNGDLWSTGSTGPVDLGLGMMPGTSPSLTELTYGGWQIAFQANTGVLWSTGSDGTGAIGTLMDPASSPSITAEPGGGYEVAYQSNQNQLEIAGTYQTAAVSPVGAVAPGTNPAIMAPAGNPQGGYQIAFHDSDSTLHTFGQLDNSGITGWAMAPGTSPSIAAVPPTPNGSLPFEIAFHSNDGTLWGDGGLIDGPIGYPMAPGASPDITGVYLPAELTGSQVLSGYQIAYEGSTGTLWTTIGSPAFTPQHINTDSGVHLDASVTPSVTSLLP